MTIEQRLRRLEDLEEIRVLKQRYCKYCDYGWEGAGQDGAKVAELFVADGIWDTALGGRCQGRAAIADHFTRHHRANRGLSLHMAINPAIEIDGERASGSWNGLVASSAGGRAIWIGGRYEDEFVRTAVGWRFTRLKFYAAFWTPYEDGWIRTRFIEQS